MVVIAGDARLLSLGRRNAQAEVDKLYRRHSDEVLRYALLVLRSRPDAEDVVQTTFIRAYRALARGERVQKPRNWLIKIAHNECRRALQVRGRRSVEVELQDVPFEPRTTGQAEELRRALSQLAPKQREALVLRELEGRSYAEIAAALELSESAVETLIFRARRALREQLEGSLSCDEAKSLLACEAVSSEERKRLRGHLRGCAECTSLERRARGRKSALHRIASSFGLPWLGKLVAIAVTVSAVAVVAAPAERGAPAARDVMPLQVDKPDLVSAPAAARPATHAHGAWHRPHAARPARRLAPAVTTPRAARQSRRRPTPSVVPVATAAVTPAAAPQAAEPASAPVDVAAPPVAPAQPVAPAAPAAPAATPAPAEQPVVALPPVQIQIPPVTVPSVDVPSVDLPALPVPAVPTVPAVNVSVPTPQVLPLPRVP